MLKSAAAGLTLGAGTDQEVEHRRDHGADEDQQWAPHDDAGGVERDGEDGKAEQEPRRALGEGRRAGGRREPYDRGPLSRSAGRSTMT